MAKRRFGGGLALAAWCFISGCGPATGDVTGEVKYKGQALAGATITFYDAKNKAIPATIDDQGKYEAKGLAVGPAKIAILTPLPISFGDIKPAKSLLPSDRALKYADPEKSGLSLEVKGGAQVHPVMLD